MSQINDVDDLRRYLERAMQLEHATIPPYLTALYSIRPGSNSAAFHVLRTVVVEEMLHLTLAANLLNAVGGEPDLTRDGFVPRYPAHLPDGETDFEVHLQAFSPSALDTFLAIERPRMAPDPSRKLVRRPDRAGPSALGTCPVDPDMHYYSIGEFYGEIRRGIQSLADRGGSIFTENPERQVTPDYYYSGGGRIVPVTDTASAIRAIDLIVEQGEGETEDVHGPDGELAHYYRFQELALGRYYDPGDHEPDRPTGPPLDVDWTAVYPIKTDASLTDYPPGSELHAAAVAFNADYAAFLALLTRAFNGEPALLLGAVPKMFELRNAIGRLVRNPLPGAPRVHAAPTFEVAAPGRTMMEMVPAEARP